jgi:hypothetical protein
MSSAVKWGLITGMVYVMQSLVSSVLGIDPSTQAEHKALSLILTASGIIVATITVYLGIKEIRDTELNGALSIGTAIKKGLKITLIAGLLFVVYWIIYAKLVDPTLYDRIAETQIRILEERGIPEEQIEMSKKMMSYFANPYTSAFFILIMTCFIGLIQSLIAGAILKKDAPPMVPPAPVV